MATIEQIKALFPLKAKVTKEIIINSEIINLSNCIGANTLKQSIPKEYNCSIIWANSHGYLNGIRVTTKENLLFMRVTEETEVTFIVE